jgi:hypothetical protein
MDEQTNVGFNGWVRWGLMLVSCLAGSGCTTVTHYLYRHTPVHMIHDSGGYFHCADCGAVVPCSASSHACQSCLEPPFQGFTQTQWHVWISAPEICETCLPQAATSAGGEPIIESAPDELPLTTDQENPLLVAPEMGLPSAAPPELPTPLPQLDETASDDDVESPPEDVPPSDTLPLFPEKSEDPTDGPSPPDPSEPEPAADLRRLPELDGGGLSRLPTIQLERIPPLR